jgi:hypothetical protein
MSRRVYLLGVGLALVALALAFTDWALSLRPGVTESNVRRIRPGMTLEQVESILGSHPSERIDRWRGGTPDACAWYGAGGYVIVDFRKDGGVRRADWHADELELSLLARLRAWLGW